MFAVLAGLLLFAEGEQMSPTQLGLVAGGCVLVVGGVAVQVSASHSVSLSGNGWDGVVERAGVGGAGDILEGKDDCVTKLEQMRDGTKTCSQSRTPTTGCPFPLSA